MAYHHRTSIYLLRQAQGQWHILTNRITPEEYKITNRLSPLEMQNLMLSEEIRRYSEDSLDYRPTENFRKIYDQKGSPVLWVLTASYPYELKPHLWEFPIVGKVSYKGFFERSLADREALHFRQKGFDTDVRMVSAWSTLGWFSDPLLSNMLKRSKGRFCNLLFHELFHATYYAPDNVDVNENLANFIAHKATLKFLRSDSSARAEYLVGMQNSERFMKFMQRKCQELKALYLKTSKDPGRYLQKLRFYVLLSDSIRRLPYMDSMVAESRIKEILNGKNAVFIDYEQYDSKQDSLENAFNKFYKGDLKKMVRDLRQK